MRKSYARHVVATNLLTTTNKFPSAAMARRVAYLLTTGFVGGQLDSQQLSLGGPVSKGNGVAP